jgi:hypothetical protein
MIEFKPKLWVGLGAVALAAGVAACGPGGEAGGEAGAKTATATQAAPAGEGEGEGKATNAVAAAPTGEGEAGASTAYADIDPASAFGLRATNLAGFALVARRAHEAGASDEASVLVGQGLLEVLRPHEADFAAAAPDVKPAYEALVAAIDAKKPKAEIDKAFDAALKTTADAAGKADGKAVLDGMLSITGGLYQGVILPEGADPIEWQHALGAALAAKDAFTRAKPAFTKIDAARAARLESDLDAIVALFPGHAIPDAPTPTAQALSAVSRARLTLSGLR